MVEKPLNAASFGSPTGAIIDDNGGDLIYKMVLRVEISEVVHDPKQNPEADPGRIQFGWVKNLGQALIEECKIVASGTSLYPKTGDWSTIWSEISETEARRELLDRMLGNREEVIRIDHADPNGERSVIKDKTVVYCPLIFPFCRHAGLAMPVSSPHGQKVEFQIKFRNLESLYIGTPGHQFRDVKIISASVWVTAVTLSGPEAQLMSANQHRYLIDDAQSVCRETINSTTAKTQFQISGQSKGLYWVIRNHNYLGGRFMVYDALDWERAREEAARKLLLAQYDLDQYGLANLVSADVEYGSYQQGKRQYDAIDPTSAGEEARFVFDDSYSRAAFDGQTMIGRLSLSSVLLGSDRGDLRDKVDGIIRIRVDGGAMTTITLRVEQITYNALTMEDLSRCLDNWEVDNRNCYIRARDLIVWQHDNYGVMIDGTVNPMKNARITINGTAQQEKADDLFYDAWMPWAADHSGRGKVGLNNYSFSLEPEEYQPSGHQQMSGKSMAFEMELRRPEGIVSSKDTIEVYSLHYGVLRAHRGRVKYCYE